MLVVTALVGNPIGAAILGGVFTLTGVVGLIRNKQNTKLANGLLIGAGVLGLATLILPGAVSGLALVSGLGLIGFGIFNFIKFSRGLKSRS